MDNLISKEEYKKLLKDDRGVSNQLSLFSEGNVPNNTDRSNMKLLSSCTYKKNNWMYIQGFIPSEVNVKYKNRQEQNYVNPVPQQSFKHGIKRHKNGDPVIFYNKKTKRKDVLAYSYQPAKIDVWKKYLQSELKKIVGGNFKLLEGDVFVNKIIFYFKFPKNTPKYKLEAAKNGRKYFKNTRPDVTDNLPKAFYDVMNGVVYKDDGQIVYEGPTLKLYGFIPGIEFKMRGKYD